MRHRGSGGMGGGKWEGGHICNVSESEFFFVCCFCVPMGLVCSGLVDGRGGGGRQGHTCVMCLDLNLSLCVVSVFLWVCSADLFWFYQDSYSVVAEHRLTLVCYRSVVMLATPLCLLYVAPAENIKYETHHE